MARREKWKTRFRVLDSNNSAPPIEDVVMASEVMLLTSAQEGFGLPYLEAAAFEKPLIARHLPNVVPDLLELGFSFPHLYEEILIAPNLLDLKRERSRQQRLWREWKAELPSLCRRAERPVLLNLAPGNGPLRRDLTGCSGCWRSRHEQSWETGVPANPFLRDWRALGETGDWR
jgi:hypothetical protein